MSIPKGDENLTPLEKRGLSEYIEKNREREGIGIEDVRLPIEVIGSPGEGEDEELQAGRVFEPATNRKSSKAIREVVRHTGVEKNRLFRSLRGHPRKIWELSQF
ncbi:MAG: hypothetical protein ACLP5H_33010 [Desulfomonilaceae bacterium]